MLVVLATTCASRLLLTKTKFGQTLRRPCGSTRDGRETSVRNSVSSFCGKAGITGNKPRSPLATVASLSDQSNEKKSKQEPSQ